MLALSSVTPQQVSISGTLCIEVRSKCSYVKRFLLFSTTHIIILHLIKGKYDTFDSLYGHNNLNVCLLVAFLGCFILNIE